MHVGSILNLLHKLRASGVLDCLGTLHCTGTFIIHCIAGFLSIRKSASKRVVSWCKLGLELWHLYEHSIVTIISGEVIKL